MKCVVHGMFRLKNKSETHGCSKLSFVHSNSWHFLLFPFFTVEELTFLNIKKKRMMKNLNNHKLLVFLDMPAFSSHQSGCLVMLPTQSSIQMKCFYMTEKSKTVDWIIASKVKNLTLLNYQLKSHFLNGLKPQRRAYQVIFCLSGSWDINSDVLEPSWTSWYC